MHGFGHLPKVPNATFNACSSPRNQRHSLHVVARCVTAENALTQGYYCLVLSPHLPSHILQLTQTILEMMDCNIHRDPERFNAYLASAREQLQSIRSRPSPVPAPGSCASLVFDPFIARRLHSFGPIRTHALPSQEQVWDALQGLLDDWDELRLLCGTPRILTWEVWQLHA